MVTHIIWKLTNRRQVKIDIWSPIKLNFDIEPEFATRKKMAKVFTMLIHTIPCVQKMLFQVKGRANLLNTIYCYCKLRVYKMGLLRIILCWKSYLNVQLMILEEDSCYLNEEYNDSVMEKNKSREILLLKSTF